MNEFYALPTALDVGGELMEIRSDFRAVLDIITALNDRSLSNEEKALVALSIMYVDADKISADNAQEALDKCLEFIAMGEKKEEKRKQPKLMDWQQDFPFIVAPINKAVGKDIRSLDYLHWWTFVGYYNEIGEGMFSNIVSIRKKLKTGQKLDKADREFYRNNKEIVDFKVVYTDEETATLKEWGAM